MGSGLVTLLTASELMKLEAYMIRFMYLLTTNDDEHYYLALIVNANNAEALSHLSIVQGLAGGNIWIWKG